MTAIPFVRDFNNEHGRCDTLSPRIRRVVARNPGPFTWTGTNTFIVGHGEVAVIDPGPMLEEHQDAILAALAGERVTHVFVTHHHLDHSPLAHPIARRFGACVYGFGPPRHAPTGGELRLEAGDDTAFRPDRRLTDGDIFRGPDWTIEALHTPGHTSNHVGYALGEENVFFCGDHVMAWSTSVVTPPDGHMGQYIEQLDRIRRRGFDRLWPAHGPAVENPDVFLKAYIEHRHAREMQILRNLEAGPKPIRALVDIMYADVDRRLHPAAALSVLAHLIRLVETGQVECSDAPTLAGTYRLARDRPTARRGDR